MKNYMIGIMFVIACGTGGCEKDTFHDTGLANGVYDGTAWEYMQAGHGNWDSLVIMIRKAGLADLSADDGVRSDESEYRAVPFANDGRGGGAGLPLGGGYAGCIVPGDSVVVCDCRTACAGGFPV